MKYFLFLDESGDHGLSSIDENFPIFVLCGVLISESHYQEIENKVQSIKSKFWGNKKVIFHSRDIRKCEKEFVLLFDQNIKKDFYVNLNQLVSISNYEIICSAIDKQKYVFRYGRLSNDVYEISLSFIIERAIFSLDAKKESNKSLEVIIECRGKKEDNKLNMHFQRLCSRGTGFVDPLRLNNYNISISFKRKNENITGLQLSDLIAYPIARFVLDSARANPSFDILKSKIYSKDGKLFGLKIFP